MHARKPILPPARIPFLVPAVLAVTLASLTGTPAAWAVAAAPPAARAAPAVTAGGAVTGTSQSVVATTAKILVVLRAAQATRAAGAGTARSAPGTVTVRSGDSLSGLAQAVCAQPQDWTGLYDANRGTIGPSPNVIKPGQVLTATCRYDPGLLGLASPAQASPSSGSTRGHSQLAAAVHTRASDGDGLPPGGAYCKPNCWGDGDGDGFDLDHPPGQSAPTAHAGTSASSSRKTGGLAVAHPAAPARTGDGDGLPPGGAYCKPNCWGDGDGDGFDLNHPPGQSAPTARPAARPAYQAPAQAPARAAGTGSSYSAAPGSFQQCVISRESGGSSQVMNSTGHYGLYQFSAGTWAAYGGNPADFGHASVAEQNQVFQQAYAQAGTSPWAAYDGCG